MFRTVVWTTDRYAGLALRRVVLFPDPYCYLLPGVSQKRDHKEQSYSSSEDGCLIALHWQA